MTRFATSRANFVAREGRIEGGRFHFLDIWSTRHAELEWGGAWTSVNFSNRLVISVTNFARAIPFGSSSW